jgi:hypothetical protein
MLNSLSLYTSKLLREHPLGFWSLQDQCDYLSSISNSNKDMTLWDSNSQISIESSYDKPRQSENLYKVSSANVGALNLVTVSLRSPVIGNFSDFNDYLGNFTLSTFFKGNADNILAVTMGVVYEDATYGEYKVSKRFPTIISDKWLMLSQTFDVPTATDIDYSIFFEIEFLSDTTTSETSFLFNGLSLGQWSEEFVSSSSGVVPENLVEKIHGLEDGSLVVKMLGSLESTKDGYVIVNNNQLKARNAGIPLVYGSNTSLTLYPNGSSPSLVIPGMGFLNEIGQYKTYTFESWFRINAFVDTDIKIIGPVASQDGVYVNGPFLKLKLGSQEISHYVGEWYRPMLLHISMFKNNLIMYLNAEEVGRLIIDRESLTLPAQEDNGYSNDWIGFYRNELVDLFELGPVSIYSYPISNVLAKKRWVYGQGVDNPEALNTAFGGKNVSIDFQYSKYSNNYSYPKFRSWSAGISDNLSTNTDYLSIPSFKEITLQSPTLSKEEILANNLSQQNEDSEFILIPEHGYFYFENMNILPNETKSIVAVFKSLSQPSDDEEILLKLVDRVSGNFMSVTISGESIKYSYIHAGIKETIAETRGFYPGEKFAIGIDFDRFSEYFSNSSIRSFLNNKNSLSLYVAGDGVSKSFNGKVYSIGINNEFANTRLYDYFDQSGLVWNTEQVIDPINNADAGYYSTTFWQFLMDGGTVAQYAAEGLVENSDFSYKIHPLIKNGKMTLDSDINGSWTSTLPLSYFGKNVVAGNGQTYYDMDFIQFNVEYPSPSRNKIVESVSGSWTYQDLYLKYSHPSQKRYSDLDNHLYTGYIDYEDLKNNKTRSYVYDTSKSLARTYVYFKPTSSESFNKAYYSNTVLATNDGMVMPGTEWVNSRYEVVDGMIIYPPADIDFTEYSIAIDIDIKIDNISDKPLAIGNLALSSVALSDTVPTPIGTRFGSDIYPFTENGFYYDYKKRNPFTIYKGSTPHLYLTEKNGITLKGRFDSRTARGIEIPVNTTRTPNHKMIAMQMFAMYSQDFFPYSPTEVLDIKSDKSHIKFYIEAIQKDGLRGRIFAINVKTGQLENGIGYFINGQIVKDPVLTVKQWSAIGMGFSNYVDFSVTGGAIRITGPLTINNLSHYNGSSLQQVQTISPRPWFSVRESGYVHFDWSYWEGVFRWFEVLVLSSSNFYGIDPSDIYNSYVGTSKLIFNDVAKIRFNRKNGMRYRLFMDSKTTNFTLNAV